ncbi:hypothetical protein [Blastococcus brunescens]|uniref:Uncharacterized protein n=1 Tax=Blastococcus brunescens TaxID=1564165 RepID=A0ABZ1AYW8_9ACTN|nr:hypothetical protein [Blastococcus sp. BMG 8361]WRL63761.1 hypothetical protein U6N30_29650 [Blastococcus sp. BMG 8361]
MAASRAGAVVGVGAGDRERLVQFDRQSLVVGRQDVRLVGAVGVGVQPADRGVGVPGEHRFLHGRRRLAGELLPVAAQATSPAVGALSGDAVGGGGPVVLRRVRRQRAGQNAARHHAARYHAAAHQGR